MPTVTDLEKNIIRCGLCGHFVLCWETEKAKIRTTCRDFKCRAEILIEIDGGGVRQTVNPPKRNQTNGDPTAQTK